jgi:exosortase/archaeosortase family protein
MKGKEAKSIAVRYISLLVLSFFILDVLYFIFTPLTAYPSYFLLSIFYGSATLVSLSIIAVKGSIIQLAPACIAGAAYFLLLALNLTTPMSKKKRLRSILFLCISFLLVNILRIVLFSALFISHFEYFDITHIATWYVGSTLLVAIIWFFNVWFFSIKDIPIYTDVLTLIKNKK